MIRSPRWILSHLFVVALIVAMIIAGLWQIDRHRERRDRNDTIAARSDLPPVDIADIAGPESTVDIGTDEQFRRVTVTGVYAAEDEVRVRNRTNAGAAGTWVLTPLVTDEGWAVVVNRGFVPRIAGTDNVAAPPPSGRVIVTGYVQPSRVAEGFQQSDPTDGRLDSLARPDIERLAAQVDYQVAPLWVQLELPDDYDYPDPPWPIALPALDAGPHASYAAQWFIFTTIAIIGYPLVLRRVVRGNAESLPDDIPA